MLGVINYMYYTLHTEFHSLKSKLNTAFMDFNYQKNCKNGE